VLCVLGSGLGLSEMERIAAGFGGFVLDREYSEAAPDPRMPEAFEACMAAASFDEADRAAVESHDTVGYLLSAPMMREPAADTSRRLLAATAALLRSGATAVKNVAIYLLTDPRADEIEDGAGFRMTEDSPRWSLRTGTCDRYDEDDLFFNPYGYVRLTRSE
jgi:hypothetical protein